MKKLFLVGALALFGAMNAQETKFGIKAGYANSKFNSNEEDLDFEGLSMSEKGRSGYYLGGFVEYQFNEKFALVGELQIADLGGKYEGKLNDSGYYATLDMNAKVSQILIPITAKYYATPKIAVSGGPFVGFVVSNKINLEYKDSNLPSEILAEANALLDQSESEINKSFDESLEKTTLGLQIGAEYNFYKGIFVEGKYNLGLSNLEKDSDTKTKMNYIQIGLGYKF